LSGEHAEQPPPGVVGPGVGPDQRVVEIEQDGARQRHQRAGRAKVVGAGLTTTPRLVCTSITARARSERPSGKKRKMPSTPDQPLGLVIASTEKSPPDLTRARFAASATAS